jgi:hypothetical protein
MTQEKERLEVERSLEQLNSELMVRKAQFKCLKEQGESYLIKVQRAYHDKLNDDGIYQDGINGAELWPFGWLVHPP